MEVSDTTVENCEKIHLSRNTNQICASLIIAYKCTNLLNKLFSYERKKRLISDIIENNW